MLKEQLTRTNLKELGFRKSEISHNVYFQKLHGIHLVLVLRGNTLVENVSLFLTNNNPKRFIEEKLLIEDLNKNLHFEWSVDKKSLERLVTFDKKVFIENIQRKVLSDIILLNSRVEVLNNNIDKLEDLKTKSDERDN